jgi:hypothetical protein
MYVNSTHDNTTKSHQDGIIIACIEATPLLAGKFDNGEQCRRGMARQAGLHQPCIGNNFRETKSPHT